MDSTKVAKSTLKISWGYQILVFPSGYTLARDDRSEDGQQGVKNDTYQLKECDCRQMVGGSRRGNRNLVSSFLNVGSKRGLEKEKKRRSG